MARIQVENVTKVYDGEVVAVRNASFTAGDGEFVVLVGPSGCGKSTLLRMVAGLEAITEGTVSIDGRVVNEVPPRERDVAMVFQNYALYPHMSVKDNLTLGLRIRKTPRAEIEQRVGEAAALLGIEQLLDRRPAQLSGGQRQRVAVGRAIVRRPRVFLFDEPLSNLDADMRLEMRTEINRLHTRLAATMLYVTHDQVEAMTLADRIVVLRDGQVQQVAAPLELYNRPANRFVAGFVGSPAMNFWPVRVEAAASGGGAGTGAASVIVGGRATAINGALPRALAALARRDVVLGVRPEDLHLADDHTRLPALWAALESTVDVVEPLGAETLLHFRVGDARSVVRTAAATRIKPGAVLRLCADLTRAHFFDPASGATLLSWPGA